MKIIKKGDTHCGFSLFLKIHLTFNVMKKIFLLFAVIAAFSLTSCGGGDASNVPDGNSQATSIDPNDPNQAPPQVQEISVVEENASAPAEQTAPESQASTAEQSKPANQ